jgi:hypothetical protein
MHEVEKKSPAEALGVAQSPKTHERDKDEGIAGSSRRQEEIQEIGLFFRPGNFVFLSAASPWDPGHGTDHSRVRVKTCIVVRLLRLGEASFNFVH